MYDEVSAGPQLCVMESGTYTASVIGSKIQDAFNYSINHPKLWRHKISVTHADTSHFPVPSPLGGFHFSLRQANRTDTIDQLVIGQAFVPIATGSGAGQGGPPPESWSNLIVSQGGSHTFAHFHSLVPWPPQARGNTYVSSGRQEAKSFRPVVKSSASNSCCCFCTRNTVPSPISI